LSHSPLIIVDTSSSPHVPRKAKIIQDNKILFPENIHLCYESLNVYSIKMKGTYSLRECSGTGVGS